MFQFITDAGATRPVGEQIREYIAGGGKWVTVDMPDASDEEVSKVIEEIKPLCIEKEVFLLLTSRVELAKTLDVGGVFLRKGDMLPSKARLTLGPAAVIGVEANTIDDIKAVRSLDVDYIGLSPFEDGDNALGIEGIRTLDKEMRELEIDIAHVTMGGIKLDDITALIETGVNGIALSEALARSENMEETTSRVLKEFDVD